MTLLNSATPVQLSGPERRRGRVSRWLRRFVVAVPVLVVACFLGINLVLMLPAVKNRMSGSVSRVIGATTEIGRVTWSPWAGIRARNIRIAALEEAIAVTDQPFFESDTAWVKVRIWSLFKGVVDVTEVGVDAPRIACVRATDGRLLLPFNRGGRFESQAEVFPANPDIQNLDEGAALLPEVTSDEVDPEVAAVEPEQGAESAARGKEEIPTSSIPNPVAPVERKRSVEVRIGDLVIKEGNVTLLGERNGQGIGELRNFEMRVNLEGSGPGSFEASGATLLGKIEVGKIDGEVTASKGGFQFREMSAAFGDGNISGSADLALTSPGAPFSVNLTTEGLKPSKLLNAKNGIMEPEAQTFLNDDLTVNVQIRGYARALSTVAGAVRFQGLQFPVEQILSTSSLKGSAAEKAGNLDFEIALVRFRLSNGGIVLDDFNFNADRVVVRAAGDVSSSGDLNLIVRTYVPASSVSAIGSFMQGWPENRLMHFAALNYTDYIYRDMRVQGMISEPAVDAWSDGTFYTVPALLDEVTELRESARRQAEKRLQPASTTTEGDSFNLAPVPELPRNEEG